jgi:hypothetical protein
MSVSAISGNYQISAVAPVQAGQVQAVPTPAAFASTPDQAEFSQAGSALSQLMQLQKSDPDRFKQLSQNISDSLATQASASSDPMQNQILTEMSQKFAASAQTGAMPDLHSQGANTAAGYGQAAGQGGQFLAQLVAGVGNLLTGHIATALSGGLAAAIL